MTKKSNRPVVFVIWGRQYLDKFLVNYNFSSIREYQVFVITDVDPKEKPLFNINFIYYKFYLPGLLKKTEIVNLWNHFENVDELLFLDTDAELLKDISAVWFTLKKASLALTLAPFYNLSKFHNFQEVINLEAPDALNISPQYNTGVIFFRKDAFDIFKKWHELACKYKYITTNDQPFFSLSLFICNNQPFLLPYNYNFRGIYQLLIGEAFILHTQFPTKEMKKNFKWPSGFFHFYRIPRYIFFFYEHIAKLKFKIKNTINEIQIY